MLSINNLSYYIGGRGLFVDASLHIKPKDKIGLIGLNGKGKSTLLRIIDGEYLPDEGSISKAKGCTIGFLNQDLLSYQSDDAIVTVAMQAFGSAVNTQRQIEEVLHKLETEYSAGLVDKLTKLQEDFERLDGYTMQAKAEEILEGIGFTTKDLHRPLREFSGGWRMRVMLAKLLLEKPSLLMLDEPTNHLDLPSIEWIENYLRTYEGAVIVVSHDRQFLNNTIKKTVEVNNSMLTLYEGNFNFYLQERELRKEIQQNAFENQQQKIKQTERFIERFRAKATKAKQVQSRAKSLDRLERVEEVANENPVVNFKFDFAQQSGRNVVSLKNISKAYGDLQILKNSTSTIERGDKIALIGANGKGKSTLLRIIEGTEPIEGKRELGFNVNLAFFAQHQLESLNVENEILEELKQAGSNKTEQELRNTLGCFLFVGDDVFKKIKVLSGGEKSRVALAKTLLLEANFLMLDEPTNHLDMQSENILIQALQQYKGSFVIVSHNRHFVRQVANKVWYIENHEIKEYPGTYDEYHYWLETNQKKEIPVKSQEKKTKVKPNTKPRNDAKLDVQKKELATIEKKIGNLEADVVSLEKEMEKSDVYSDPTKLSEINGKYLAAKDSLEEANHKWEALAELIEG